MLWLEYSLAHKARFSSLRTKIFVAGDENLLCAGNTYKRFLSLTMIFNIKYAGKSSSSLTTEDKISVASDKNRAVCARLYDERFIRPEYTIFYKNLFWPSTETLLTLS